jgi:peptidoglycan hydrolase-like protein with peptidoglycan-binding domain
LGYYAGNITGFYDGLTLGAVKAFQLAQGITSDGVVGPTTYYRLGLSNNVAAPSPLGLAWPPAPAPTVTVCSVALTSTTSNLTPYGEASLVINQSQGFESLDVVGNFLPSPSSYGSSYTIYLFTLTNPSTLQVLVTQPMVRVSGPTPPTDWAGAYSPGVSTITKGIVNVYPAVSASGPMGASILRGNLQNCH